MCARMANRKTLPKSHWCPLAQKGKNVIKIFCSFFFAKIGHFGTNISWMSWISSHKSHGCVGMGVPKISTPFTLKSSVVNTPICSPLQSNCNGLSVFITNAEPNTWGNLGSYLHRSHCLKFTASSHQALVMRLNGRHRGWRSAHQY